MKEGNKRRGDIEGKVQKKEPGQEKWLQKVKILSLQTAY